MKLTVKVPALIEEAVDVRFPVAAAALTLALAFAVYQAKRNLRFPLGLSSYSTVPISASKMLCFKNVPIDSWHNLEMVIDLLFNSK